MRNSVGVVAAALMTWLATITVATGQTPGQDQRSPFMRVFGHALPPIGHIDFCQRHPEDCRPVNERPGRITLDAKRWHEMRAINDYVNRTIEPATDLEIYGRLEYWAYPTTRGDCEDYALLKQKLLIEAGWPRNALLITVVRDEIDEGHAILTVRAAEGDFILDNKRPDIIAWNDSPYAFVKRQSFQDHSLWMSLSAPEDPSEARVSSSRRH